MAQTTLTRGGMCLFRFCWYCCPFNGSNFLRNPNCGARIGVFKPDVQKIQTFIFSKLLHRLLPNFSLS